MTVYLLYGDETNLEPESTIEFFMYGAIWLPVDRLSDLHKGVKKIRAETGFLPGDKLKFSTRTRPKERVSAEQHKEAKRRVIELAAELGVQFAVVAAHHKVAKDPETRWRYQVDSMLLGFRDFLRDDGSTGIVVLDRFQQAFPHMEARFQHGVVSERKKFNDLPLDEITLIAAGASESSHAASVADIVLGSFRYCVNDTDDKPQSHEMLRSLVPLLRKKRVGDKLMVREYGLKLRPKEVLVPEHKARYDALVKKLERIANADSTSQPDGDDQRDEEG